MACIFRYMWIHLAFLVLEFLLFQWSLFSSICFSLLRFAWLNFLDISAFSFFEFKYENFVCTLCLGVLASVDWWIFLSHNWWQSFYISQLHEEAWYRFVILSLLAVGVYAGYGQYHAVPSSSDHPHPAVAYHGIPSEAPWATAICKPPASSQSSCAIHLGSLGPIIFPSWNIKPRLVTMHTP